MISSMLSSESFFFKLTSFITRNNSLKNMLNEIGPGIKLWSTPKSISTKVLEELLKRF